MIAPGPTYLFALVCLHYHVGVACVLFRCTVYVYDRLLCLLRLRPPLLIFTRGYPPARDDDRWRCILLASSSINQRWFLEGRRFVFLPPTRGGHAWCSMCVWVRLAVTRSRSQHAVWVLLRRRSLRAPWRDSDDSAAAFSVEIADATEGGSG